MPSTTEQISPVATNLQSNERRRCTMMPLQMDEFATMSDRHLGASQFLKEQTCQKFEFARKSSKDLSSDTVERTDKLINILSAHATMGTGAVAESISGPPGRSFRSLNATRIAAEASQSKAPTQVDRKERLMKMYSLQPNCQQSIKTMSHAATAERSTSNSSLENKKSSSKRRFWKRSTSA